jgi:hypothetical protein
MRRSGNSRAPTRTGWRLRAAWLLGLAVLLALLWFWGPLTGGAKADAAYAARIGCSCRFVAGRSLEDCKKDFRPGRRMVMLGEDEEDRSVTARVPPFASETAHYRRGEGCTFVTEPK